MFMSFTSVAGYVFICLCQEATRQKLIRILIKTSQSIEYTSVKIYIMHGCYSRGRFKDRHEISNIRALIFQYLLCFNVWMKYTSLNVWVEYFVWNFKGYLWNILPIHWEIYFLHIVKILKSVISGFPPHKGLVMWSLVFYLLLTEQAVEHTIELPVFWEILSDVQGSIYKI